jgi:hypothetical protein
MTHKDLIIIPFLASHLEDIEQVDAIFTENEPDGSLVCLLLRYNQHLLIF